MSALPVVQGPVPTVEPAREQVIGEGGYLAKNGEREQSAEPAAARIGGVENGEGIAADVQAAVGPDHVQAFPHRLDIGA